MNNVQDWDYKMEKLVEAYKKKAEAQEEVDASTRHLGLYTTPHKELTDRIYAINQVLEYGPKYITETKLILLKSEKLEAIQDSYKTAAGVREQHKVRTIKLTTLSNASTAYNKAWRIFQNNFEKEQKDG